VNNDVDAIERPVEPVAVAHVADEVADAGVLRVGEHLPHVVLLELVAAEDDQLPRLMVPEHMLHELDAEGAGTAGNENDAIVQHILSLPVTPSGVTALRSQ
jgi:hypothetical protein